MTAILKSRSRLKSLPKSINRSEFHLVSDATMQNRAITSY
jgi:hypothetical protein